MPELPEVEIAARRLRAALPGRRITGLEVADPKILRGGNALDWQDRLIGATFLGVDRRAKYLLLPLNTNETLIAHLRMTGKLVVDPTPLPPPRHGEGETRSRGSFPPLRAGEGGRGVGSPRFLAHLGDRSRLVFPDPRRFGQLWLVATTDRDALPELKRLGPDALLEPSSAVRLAALGAGSRRAIKTWLVNDGRLYRQLVSGPEQPPFHGRSIRDDRPVDGGPPGTHLAHPTRCLSRLFFAAFRSAL